MSCEVVKMKDGTKVIACVKPGETLTDADRAVIAEYVQFCRDRKAKKAKQCTKADGDRA